MWGSNAVNGIINIISKNSKDTQGFMVSVGGGSEDKGLTAFVTEAAARTTACTTVSTASGLNATDPSCQVAVLNFPLRHFRLQESQLIPKPKMTGARVRAAFESTGTRLSATPSNCKATSSK